MWLFNVVMGKDLQGVGHNISAATIIQLRVSNKIMDLIPTEQPSNPHITVTQHQINSFAVSIISGI